MKLTSTVNPPLAPGQAEALVEEAVPILREILQAYRQWQAKELAEAAAAQVEPEPRAAPKPAALTPEAA
jgi:hypothetical protein